ncbi:MAG: hypothetical protein UZ13_02265, partial [Chloroflexi bacterium OLB13]
MRLALSAFQRMPGPVEPLLEL